MLRKVTISQGTVEGLPAADPRITSFKGIPYAEPPVGNLRFHAPVPAGKWEGVLKAYNFSKIAVQPKPYYDPNDLYCREWSVDKDQPMGEDCLTVNVWTPAKAADEKLPVYVWIYGGGWQTGFSAEMEFDGERIARRGIVVVTMNYRLNCFGFLCHPEITAENPAAPANFGLLDQRLAMKWVKNNIAAFGGDPDNMTLGGQSAGGGSVLHQMMYGRENNLYKRVMVDSGIFINPFFQQFPLRNLKEAEQIGVDFFNFLGVKTLKEARALETDFIQQKWEEYGGWAKSIQSWLPVMDDKFVKGDFFSIARQKDFEPVPMMTGQTTDEFKIAKPGTDQFFSMVKLGIWEYRKILEENGHDKNDMWYYEFDVPIPGWDRPGKFHSVDLWFWFETLAKCWRPFTGVHYDISRQMCNYLCNFIKTGNPNGIDYEERKLPNWEQFSTANPKKMIFDVDCHQILDNETIV
ncbi:MAG: carboxylesterase family protein [Spirochaetaceae bacterium]|nr:carboxylesterase family protein [Spirochaetaceae bacterium]